MVTVNDGDTLNADLTAAFVTSDIDCAGYVEFGDRLLFNVTTTGSLANLTKTVTLTKPIPSGRPSDPGDEWRFQFCFQSQDSFQALPTYSSDPQSNYDRMLQALSDGGRAESRERIAVTVRERSALAKALNGLKGVVRVYSSEGNFLLVRFARAEAVFQHLLSRGVVVRDLRAMPQLDDALRISVGTPDENEAVIAALREVPRP